jgi:hypothetical protein
MSCFICSDDNDLIEFKSLNDVTLQICHCCYDIIDGKIRCSHCNRVVNSIVNGDDDYNLKAKIGRNGIVCEECEANGVNVAKGNVFKRIPNSFRGYSYKPNPIFNKLDNEMDDLFMGVELEIGGLHTHDTVVRFCNEHAGHIFYYKSDGSIRGYGCEIVSHPATLNYHLSEQSGWEVLFEDFNRVGFVSGERTNTGLHIHINKNALTTKQMKKIDLVVNQWQDLFCCIGRRNENGYCHYTRKYHSQWGTSNDRYQSVNFSNSNTVEFRFFCGTNKVEELFASLQAVKTIVILTKDITYDVLYEDENEVKNKMKQIIKNENFTYFSKMMVEKTGDTSWQI